MSVSATRMCRGWAVSWVESELGSPNPELREEIWSQAELLGLEEKLASAIERERARRGRP